MRKYTVALAQINSGSDKNANLTKAERLIAEAAAKKAKFILFPENMNCMCKEPSEFKEDLSGESCARIAAAAKANNIWVNLGSIKEAIPDEERVYNTSVLFNPQGEQVAVYRKLHPCDMTSKPGLVSKESDKVCPGDEIVTVDTELGHFGLSICYDIRFPEFFRAMALRGAQIMCVPACFGVTTGETQWEILMRARAIENAAYVFACGQCGVKENGVLKNGTSMIIDPWGKVLAKGDQTNEVLLFAEVDLDYADDVLNRLGELKNRRTDIYNLQDLKK